MAAKEEESDKNNRVKLKNITVREYLSLDYTFNYDTAFELIEPKNWFKGRFCRWEKLTFDQMTLVKRIMINPAIEDFGLLYRITYKTDFLQGSIIEFFQSKKWLDKKVIETLKMEEKLLSSVPDPKLIAAGIERLKKFGELNTKIDLAAQFGKTPTEIGEWKYTDVLLVKARNITMGEIQKAVK